jgi:hypothetical protein
MALTGEADCIYIVADCNGGLILGKLIPVPLLVWVSAVGGRAVWIAKRSRS